MPASKKPRKKYRPKPVMTNAFEYAIESTKPLVEHGSYVLDWRLKNNAAFGALLKAEAKRRDLDVLVAARNIVEAMVVTLKGADINGTLVRSEAALIDICARANAGNGTAMRAPEIQALRDLMDFHDALLDVVTVQQFETALNYARSEATNGRTKRIKVVSQ